MEHITMDTIQNASPEERARLESVMMKRVMLNIAGFVVLKFALLFGIRYLAKKYWTSNEDA